MNKLLKTKRRLVFITKNEDGSLNIFVKPGVAMENAGMFILSLGGIEALWNKAEDFEGSLEDFKNYEPFTEEERKAHFEERQAKKIERENNEVKRREEKISAYKNMLEKYGERAIETNEENLRILLNYLNLSNWGGWELPKMTISYACHQYDCYGKQATTIKLDEPIEVFEELGSMFQVGAPHGHLRDYRRI
ncbi:MAG: hypothetical protein ACRC9X_04870 [Bacteroidales bacterium]